MNFGAFVEEGGVVLVAFEDEWLASRTLEAGAEILRDAADEKGWRELGLSLRRDFIDPRQHAGGGGLPWVPATTSDSFPGRNSCWMVSARERKGMR